MKNLIFTLILFLSGSILLAQKFDSKTFSQLDFRFIGPDGNRMIAVVGEPGNPNVSYSGAASGGIWKTDDAGVTWKSIFDDTEDSSIGALAIAPSNTQQVWAGTGETFLIRPAHAVGNGVYKSSNAGKTWKNMGLEKTYRISRVIVHPTDTNTVYVASLGHAHGPQQERGVYKTIDGGKNWERVFFLNENTGCSKRSRCEAGAISSTEAQFLCVAGRADRLRRSRLAFFNSLLGVAGPVRLSQLPKDMAEIGASRFACGYHE